MQKRTTLLIAVVLAVVAIGVLTKVEWNTAESEVKLSKAEHQDQKHEHDHEEEVDDTTSSELDDRALKAAESIRNGQSSADIMQGVQELRAILAIDSNHVSTIELLAELSIQSGQLEKALNRYEKLISLQPENTDYRKRRDALCEQLGREDC